MTTGGIRLTGFGDLQEIYRGPVSCVYRGVRADGVPVILKALVAAVPRPIDAERLQREYDIAGSLDHDGVIKVLDLITTDGVPVLVFEDFGGRPLGTGFQETLETFLDMAIQISTALGYLHDQGVLHKDISPANIIWNAHLQRAKIIDFGIAGRIARASGMLNPNYLEGSPHYLAPEQTGRMNRIMDYRSDYYGLGATLYHILCKSPPFESDDLMELVHCHLAKTPTPPHERNPGIPEAVSAIIMKLLAKEQEDRYQSAAGMLRDLENCAAQLRENGFIKPFTPGERDYSPKLTMPGKLYGREAEITRISRAFESFQSLGSGIVFIAGYSGIGKTSLVKELFKPITRERGYFAEGKYDQLQRNVPWNGIASAFNGLVRQLLTQSETDLVMLRSELMEALGSNGRVIIDVIPDVELIIGTQPEVSALAAAESQNRFQMVFQNFLEVICRRTHPLVVFLDDLQWVDMASLNLIETMMSHNFPGKLLLIASYRDNEVDATHPLMITRKKLLELGRIQEEIVLDNLGVQPITEWLQNLLKLMDGQGSDLAELIYHKTGGNPFFVNQFLKTLNQEQALVLDSVEGWRWDSALIESLNITDNVVDLMVRKLHRFPKETRQIVSVASCLGNRFDIEVLARLVGKPPGKVLLALLPVIDEGLVFPLFGQMEGQSSANLSSGYYRFMHDRVQQAGYALLEQDQRLDYHLRIGRLLSEQYLDGENALLFEVVDHLMTSVQMLDDSDERLQLVELSRAAGRKAKNSSAYRVAKTYLEQGLAVLSAMGGDHMQGEKSFLVYQDLAEVVYLTGDFETAGEYINEAFRRADTILKKAAIHFLNTRIHMMKGQYEESLRVGEEALNLLGVAIPEPEDRQHALEGEIQRADAQLEGRSIASIINDEEVTDAESVLVNEILLSMISASFFISEMELYSLLIVKLARISLENGLTPGSCTGFAFYANILASSLKRYREAYELGQVAVQIAERFNDMEQKGQCSLMFASYLNHWCAPVGAAEAVASEGYRCALEAGSLNWAGYNLWSKSWSEMFSGKPLAQVHQGVEEGLAFGEKTKNEQVVSGLTGMDLVLSNLLGQTSGRLDFSGSRLTESQFLEKCEREGRLNAVGFFIWKAQALFILDEVEAAAEAIHQAGEWIDIIIGHYHNAEFHFYRALILLSLMDRQPDRDAAADWKLIESDRAQLNGWAVLCPHNFRHKLCLVDAEIGRFRGAEEQVMDLFEESMDLAASGGFIQDEALAAELAAFYWERIGRRRFARMYRQSSQQKYQQWGLHAKAKLMNASISLATTGGDSTGRLDLHSIMKFSNAIANEIRLVELLKTIMRIVIENAGAERGFLLLEKKDGWYLEAQGAVNETDVQVLQSIPLETMHSDPNPILSAGVVTYSIRTREALLLDDAANDSRFIRDRYMVLRKPKSILSMPLLKQGKLIGVLYLENNLNTGAFTNGHLEILRLLSAGSAVSIENARLYGELNLYSRNLEQMVADRTRELDLRNHELQSLDDIVKTVNAKIDPQKVYQALLGQGPILFPKARRGALILPIHEEGYGIVASSGIDMGAFNSVRWTRQQLIEGLVESGFPRGRELFLTGPDHLPEGAPTLDAHIMVLTLSLDGPMDGFLIWSAAEPFDDMDVKRFVHFGSHAVSAVAKARNLSELQEKNQAILRAQNQLVVSEKMATLGTLTAGVAHEFNNPNNFIYGSIQNLEAELASYRNTLKDLVEEDTDDDTYEVVFAPLAGMLEHCHSIKAGSKRIKAVVDSMRLFSRLDEADWKLVDLLAGLKATMDLIKSQYPGVVFETEPGPAVELYCRPAEINQVYLNLILNACQAIEERREKGERFEGRISGRGYVAGTNAVIEIIDNGPGVPKSNQERIFEAFFTTKPPGKGMGLGLYSAWRIMESHKGEIEIHETPGGGATFKLSFPVG